MPVGVVGGGLPCPTWRPPDVKELCDAGGGQERAGEATRAPFPSGPPGLDCHNDTMALSSRSPCSGSRNPGSTATTSVSRRSAPGPGRGSRTPVVANATLTFDVSLSTTRTLRRSGSIRSLRDGRVLQGAGDQRAVCAPRQRRRRPDHAHERLARPARRPPRALKNSTGLLLREEYNFDHVHGDQRQGQGARDRQEARRNQVELLHRHPGRRRSHLADFHGGEEGRELCCRDQFLHRAACIS
jgi:hypothetical protein